MPDLHNFIWFWCEARASLGTRGELGCPHRRFVIERTGGRRAVLVDSKQVVAEIYVFQFMLDEE